ncbi:MAG: hypothetical protein EOP58_07375 [Sphingomonadales bacterium]|nr:MAG: hypothetical protein EOP58_07375 [Sphingomonadales bacterium]
MKFGKREILAGPITVLGLPAQLGEWRALARDRTETKSKVRIARTGRYVLRLPVRTKDVVPAVQELLK